MRRSHCNVLTGGRSTIRPAPTIPSFIDSALVPPRAAMPPGTAVEQMANDMRDAAARGGGITGDELELLGFTADQVATLGSKARIRAQKLAGATV